MQELKEYTPKKILSMDYNQIIGLVRETNRPPGGLNSIYQISLRSFLKPSSVVLEIGTSTGFTAIELARLVGCKVVAIDINPQSLEEARKRAKEFGVEKLITFEVQDATNLKYKDGSFDLVFCGNVTSLISDRDKALKEYCRVLKEGGFLAAIPMYYVKKPSEKLVKDVSEAIHVNITPLFKDFWVNFFDKKPLQKYWTEDYTFDKIDNSVVKNFVETILKRPHLEGLPSDTRKTLNERYEDFMHLFRDNLSIMGYTLILLRKEEKPFDEELFTSTKIK